MKVLVLQYVCSLCLKTFLRVKKCFNLLLRWSLVVGKKIQEKENIYTKLDFDKNTILYS